MSQNQPRLPLPIDPVLGQIAAELETQPSIVIQAAPGSGKTTRVPPALLSAQFARGREILVIEPRRLAAKLAAYRVASELGEDVGATVGYQFRFERVGGPRTRIRFLTEGMFVRQLLSDPSLSKVAVVVVDEFHERHLQGDVALGFLSHLQRSSRPDLRIVVMSATLDAKTVADYLGGARIFDVPGRLFEIRTEYLPSRDTFLDAQVVQGVRHALERGHEGDVLVFLPGVAEIRRAQERLQERSAGWGEPLLVVPLYGDLSREEQDRAIRPASIRKVILATNVAESSLTIEGVRIVIDSGLARVPSYSWWSGLPALRTLPVSRASATQRAGRAGRTAPGVCVRLYTRESFESRQEFDKPEIQRADLSETVLQLKRLGVEDLQTFPWFDPPRIESVESAIALLRRLGALDQNGKLTADGARLATIPAHPRLARLVLEGERLGVSDEACELAAIVSEGSVDEPDLVSMLHKTRRHGLVRQVGRAKDQLLRALQSRPGEPRRGQPKGGEAEIRKAILAGFPDRVAKLRALSANLSRNRGQQAELVLSGGGTARIDDRWLDGKTEYFVTVDVEERKIHAHKPAEVAVRAFCAVEPEWLFDLAGDALTESHELYWDGGRERVLEVDRIQYDGLVLSESGPVPARPGPEAAEILSREAMAKGLAAFCDSEQLGALLSRMRFFRSQSGDERFPDVSESNIRALVTGLCSEMTSFAELRQADLVAQLKMTMTAEQSRQLDRMVPEFILFRGGKTGQRRVRIHYDPGKPPWIASRLQDFFGMVSTPTVFGGRVSLVLHLLAPNQRPVQVTSDLASFWKNAYPALRKELGRRYPKHAWPEDPQKPQ